MSAHLSIAPQFSCNIMLLKCYNRANLLTFSRRVCFNYISVNSLSTPRRWSILIVQSETWFAFTDRKIINLKAKTILLERKACEHVAKSLLFRWSRQKHIVQCEAQSLCIYNCLPYILLGYSFPFNARCLHYATCSISFFGDYLFDLFTFRWSVAPFIDRFRLQ